MAMDTKLGIDAAPQRSSLGRIEDARDRRVDGSAKSTTESPLLGVVPALSTREVVAGSTENAFNHSVSCALSSLITSS